jgi:AhpD family alkylhydroperoxidase
VAVAAAFGVAVGGWLVSRWSRRQAEFETQMAKATRRPMWGLAGQFQKRILSGPCQLREEMDCLLETVPLLQDSFRNKRLNRLFAEKIMIAVSGVNGCRYCCFAHARIALANGMSGDQVAQLIDGDLGELGPEEALAVAFAMHFAETGGDYEPASFSRVQAALGSQTAEDVLVLTRVMVLANLVGNTFDAFVSRVRGTPAAGSSVADEIGVLLLLVVSVIPYGLALAVQASLVKTTDSRRSGVLVLEP